MAIGAASSTRPSANSLVRSASVRLKALLEAEARAHRDEDLRLVEEWAAVDAETWPDDRTRS